MVVLILFGPIAIGIVRLQRLFFVNDSIFQKFTILRDDVHNDLAWVKPLLCICRSVSACRQTTPQTQDQTNSDHPTKWTGNIKHQICRNTVDLMTMMKMIKIPRASHTKALQGGVSLFRVTPGRSTFINHFCHVNKWATLSLCFRFFHRLTLDKV